MHKPLIIYLDSSDISNLSDDTRRTRELVEIEKELFSLKDEGLIEFRFSHVHVIEAAPTEPLYVDLAHKRFSYIKKLCGYKCFVTPIKIIKMEALRLGATNESLIEILNDEGVWFPPLDMEDGFVDFASEFRQRIASEPDRKNRRIAERKFFEKNGNFTAFAKKTIKDAAPAFVEELCSKYPLRPENIERANKVFLETGSIKYLLNEAKKSLVDMESIGHWYAKQWDLLIPNSAYLREIGMNLKEQLVDFNRNLKSSNDNLKKLALKSIDTAKMAEENFSKLSQSLPLSIAQKIASDQKVELSQIPNWDLTPSLLSMTCTYVSLIKSIVQSGQKPRASDFGDVYHASFVPHVDFFRADGAIASAIAKAKMPLKTVIVPKLENLPEQIRLKLKNK
ncbi:hypothetical protein [Methylophilus sp. QUAN]|uniref:hypothetical protein n=1 Tax=Methylophilus sp. QUAN TaxID=2781020 RepID=UPI00188DEA17|nr:hypothetical protein [Methylophilus sp. QUAN]MBF4989785.1 hypothetical protein [Methylophilus sp. QUAN]